ncbi:hypothetical protein C0993_003093 [Termitomyces sp. T159_Od127]|nr:hypothetical protein C0993_003093 [Termitomyces sp. T159_Od127]
METKGTHGTCTKRSIQQTYTVPDKTRLLRVWFQTQEHIIKECPKYEEQRHILEEADAQVELGVLLGTTKGLEAMAKFLAKTGAFTKMGKSCKHKMKPEEEDEENDEEEDRWWARMEGNGGEE